MALREDSGALPVAVIAGVFWSDGAIEARSTNAAPAMAADSFCDENPSTILLPKTQAARLPLRRRGLTLIRHRHDERHPFDDPIAVGEAPRGPCSRWIPTRSSLPSCAASTSCTRRPLDRVQEEEDRGMRPTPACRRWLTLSSKDQGTKWYESAPTRIASTTNITEDLDESRPCIIRPFDKRKVSILSHEFLTRLSACPTTRTLETRRESGKLVTVSAIPKGQNLNDSPAVCH
jgi:hypothetical protein